MAAEIKTSLVVLKLKQVQARTAISRSGIYQKMAEGAFPPSISLGPRAVGWLESSVDQWIQSRIELSSKVGV
ncbi:AlpA family transcriptional regulator [bacterium]|nr:AlpA family transcriptional regulator [bacterium]